MPEYFWIETLGCPKNQVDSDKIAGTLLADGLRPAKSADAADVVVVNTCAFIDAARQESIDTIGDFVARRRVGTRIVVTGCLAARSGEALAAAIPEIDYVADVGVPITLSTGPRWRADAQRSESLRLMDLPRSKADLPWAYVKIAEGCDRSCGFCAIPTFRGPQASRTVESIVREVESLDVKEVVLVAQDLASFGNDRDERGSITELVRQVACLVERVRLLYLYPSSLTNGLIETIIATGVSYFDLSLQHVSPQLVRRMRRYGNSERFLQRINFIRSLDESAAFRSSFILGYPGETEDDQDRLLGFLEEADLDWVGFFPYSQEEGTYAAGLDGRVPRELALERLRECAELQDAITARKRRELVATTQLCLIDAPGVARSFREAPEIDGIIRVDDRIAVATTAKIEIVGAEGPDLIGSPDSGQLYSRVSR
ncbi:MAG TPA: MiaB/RimO family radical SAM methylthiotransferase [Acidimicrobiales bacterium]|nr:MiaB/RimO family radical SAM methylthiotransferase [Acidimicrobiales bacterium]